MKSTENFPVASRLIRRDLRPAVMDFYRFARAADNVADAPRLSPEEKLARLAGFKAGLAGAADGATQARALHDRLQARGQAPLLEHGHALLSAFRQDARGASYRDWADLEDYCARSANPVGRFLLDFHGEGAAAEAASDALCTALQVLNHLQDIRADRERLGRIYLPADWLDQTGARPEDLSASALTPALRATIDRALDHSDALLRTAAALPDLVRAPRLAGEARAILQMGRRLSQRLRRGDPLSARVAPSRADFLLAGCLGLGRALRPRPRAMPGRPKRA